MDTNKTEIIQKIKKLFALANGASTEEEAHNAMLRVKEMLTKYNLSMEEVQSFRVEECHGHSTKYIKSKYCPSYIKILAFAVGKLFHCSTMTAKETIQNTYRLQIYFIGVDMDGLVASQTFDYLVEYATAKVQKQKVNKRNYLYGFAEGISDRITKILDQEKNIPQENALVVKRDTVLQSFLERHYADVPNYRRFTAQVKTEDTNKGYQDAQEVNLDRQIEENRTSQLL